MFSLEKEEWWKQQIVILLSLSLLLLVVVVVLVVVVMLVVANIFQSTCFKQFLFQIMFLSQDLKHDLSDH